MNPTETFLFSLSTLILPGTNQSDVMDALLKIGNEIAYFDFKDLSEVKIVAYLEIVWDFFIKSAEMKSASIRVAACSSCGQFLVRLYPYFQEGIIKSYIETLKSYSKSHQCSVILASVFVFIINHIKISKINNFLSLFDTTYLFSTPQTSYNQLLPNMIKNLGNFNKE